MCLIIKDKKYIFALIDFGKATLNKNYLTSFKGLPDTKDETQKKDLFMMWLENSGIRDDNRDIIIKYYGGKTRKRKSKTCKKLKCKLKRKSKKYLTAN